MAISNLEKEIDVILGKIRDSNLRLATGRLLVHFVGEIKSLQTSIEELRTELRQFKEQK
ncbi:MULTISPECIES: hypothetical protein [Brucella/Ochrobactrum group]|uniref:hypothetical protein n=1 Tax=Brucella/Ochrobactrum group TaxID=2826938 RepID=UPI0015E84092|nr:MULTISPECIES: hypothetical protein [Brucella/Ochrobactrum group]MCH4538570.1 hypothetical protein [Ochrobactrum sp. A-1]